MNQSIESERPEDASLGAWLKAARERASLAIEQVARDLNLDVRKIQALEASDFNHLGGPVYVKGYLRKYARVVSVPEEDVLRRYEGSGMAVKQADPVPVTLGLIPDPKPLLPRWVVRTALALVALAAGVVIWNLRSTSASAPVTAQSGVVEPTVGLDDSPLQTQFAQEAAIETAATDSTQPVASNAATTQLEFHFSSDSWVEVYDASNQQVLYDLGKAGDQRTVSAAPPLRVVLGSAAGVAASVNSRPVTIPANHIDANVARFVVTASGAIQ